MGGNQDQNNLSSTGMNNVINKNNFRSLTFFRKLSLFILPVFAIILNQSNMYQTLHKIESAVFILKGLGGCIYATKGI